jgi:hypothetical protein
MSEFHLEVFQSYQTFRPDFGKLTKRAMENLVRRLVAALVVGSACCCAVAELASSDSLSEAEQRSRADRPKLEELTAEGGATSVASARKALNDAQEAHEAARARLELSVDRTGIASIAAVKEFEETAMWVATAEGEAAAVELSADPEFIATQRRLARSSSAVEQVGIFAEAKAKAVEVEVVAVEEEGGRK